jgi:hypothetical protein
VWLIRRHGVNYGVRKTGAPRVDDPRCVAKDPVHTTLANGKPIEVAISHLLNGGTSLTMDATGRFVVAWEEASGVLYVYAQRFSATGQKVGSQIVVTSAPNPGVYLSSLSMNRTGRFAVAWKDWYGTTLAAQVYDWAASVGGPVTVTGPGGQVGNSASAIDANGNVTFTWDGSEIGFRRLTAGGVLEPELLANTTTQGSHGTPSIAATGNDRFIVAWQGYGPGDDAGIFMQRFKPLGTSPLGNLIPNGEDVKSAAIWIGDKQIYGNSEQLSQARIDQSPVPIAPSTETPIAKEGNPWFSFDSHTWLAAVTDEALINDLIFVGS